MKLWHVVVFTGMLVANNAMAKSVVLSHQCSTLKNTQEPFVLVLQEGESVMKAVAQCSRDAELVSGTVVGIGALKKTTLAHKSPKNHIMTYPQHMELNAINGLIARDKGQPDVHLHVLISGDDNCVLGGHLIDGTVSASIEMTIFPMTAKVERRLDRKLGIKQISTFL